MAPALAAIDDAIRAQSGSMRRPGPRRARSHRSTPRRRRRGGGSTQQGVRCALACPCPTQGKAYLNWMRQADELARATADLCDFLISERRRRREGRVFIPTGGIDGDVSSAGGVSAIGSLLVADGASSPARNALPASVIRQPSGSRRTYDWEKMSRPGAWEAKRFVRFVQSVPLEMRMATSRRRSASGRCPPLDPAKTFSTVIWKLTPRTLMAFQDRDYRPSIGEVDALEGSLPNKSGAGSRLNR
jgi:hypothetical protein